MLGAENVHPNSNALQVARLGEGPILWTQKQQESRGLVAPSQECTDKSGFSPKESCMRRQEDYQAHGLVQLLLFRSFAKGQRHNETQASH